MVIRGLKPGDTFSDGPLFYKVLSVNEDGSYISTRVEAVEEPDNAEPDNAEAVEEPDKAEADTSDENAESKPVEAEPDTVVKKPRSNRRK